MIVRFNGELVEEGALIDPRDRGFLLGDGAFETVYVEQGRAAFLKRHVERLNEGLCALRIPSRLNADDLGEPIAELAAANCIAGPGVLRITVTRGPGARGLAFDLSSSGRPTELHSIAPLANRRDIEIRLTISDYRRYSCSAATAFKSISGYLENMLALNAARAAGAADALLLNEFGRVASATAANVFVVRDDGVVATPPCVEGALPGVVRGLIVEGERAHGVSVEQRPIEVGEARRSRIFLTNSLTGVAPAALGEAPGALAPCVERLMAWYERTLRGSLAAARA